MKTIKRIVLVVVLMLGTFTNYANNTELNSVLNAKKVKVVFKGAKRGHQLKIKDDSGIILHLEDVNQEGSLIKFFDFSKLKDGNYTLELEKDFEIIIKSINVKGKEVVFDGESKAKIFKPVIRNEKNKLMITQIAFDKKPLEVEIYYNNEIIYSETVTGDAILNRIYRLDEEMVGDYKVVLNKNNRSYTKEFNF